ncbi:MAG TPA: SRPBCC domain-containing protein [Sphingomicrobium sp.]|nr:SRPBCC domain-containing protein [Sphingomicrobium sp.]
MTEKTDLVLERTLDAPIDLVWDAYTHSEHIKKWFAPKPYMITEAKLDLRPGGTFQFRMEGPDNFVEDGKGCVLEVVPRARLTWTSALGPEFRPNDFGDKEGCEAFPFTAVATFADAGKGKTAYKVVELHRNEADREAHENMGFHDGWGTVASQLEEFARTLGVHA